MLALLEAMRVVRILDENGIDAMIAGGAVRDMLHGKEPKDFDVVVLGQVSLEEASLALEPLERQEFGEGASCTTNEAGASRHIDWVIKVFGQYTTLDIIQQSCHPTTAEEAVEAFDCTLNMVWLCPESFDIMKHIMYPKLGELIQMLPKCDFPEARSQYLSMKYPQYQWPVQVKAPSVTSFEA